MRGLLGGLALLMIAAGAASAQDLPLDDPRLRWEPIRRALCLGLTDEACGQFVWPTDRNPLLVAVGAAGSGHTSDASIEVHQLSTAPHDSRAVACLNAVALGSFAQLCAYGVNYPDPAYAGYTKIRADGPGLLMGAFAPGGIFRLFAGGSDRAFLSAHGFGVQDIPTSGTGIFALAWGSAPTQPVPYGNVYLVAQNVGGVYRIMAFHSDGSIVCLSCP
jgi:hypothetical protein